MNPFTLGRRYRQFRIYNQYTYPFLFFCLDFLGTSCQVLVLTGAVWFGYAAVEQKLVNVSADVAGPNSIVARSNSTLLNSVPSSVAVEVLAVAKPDMHKSRKIVATQEGQIRKLPMQVSGRQVSDRPLQEWRWMLDQSAGSFTIQFASSPDKSKLYASALAFNSEHTVVVFPFKKTPSNRVVYGFSSGVYDSLASAQRAIENLPASVRASKPWIRPIRVLQKQIVKTVS